MLSMGEVREVLINTRQILTEHGRCQGTMEHANGQVCLRGAILAAMTGKVPESCDWFLKDGKYNAELIKVEGTLGFDIAPHLRYADRVGGLYTNLATWNDAETTTDTMVFTLLNDVIAALTDFIDTKDDVLDVTANRELVAV